MTKSAPRQHRHHKSHKIRRAIRVHGRGGNVLGRTGLQLPLFNFAPIPGAPRNVYPKGWIFKQAALDQNALLLVGSVLVVLGLALALIRLLAG